MKVVGIVQARMGSTRLPGKVLEVLADKPALLHMLERVSRSLTLNELWVATSTSSKDDALVEAIERAGYSVFRGSEDDVLGRFYELAKARHAEVVVRLTGDCPLHDPEVIDQVVQAFLKAYPQYNYASNVIPPSYPDGLDVEVFSFAALEEAYRTCTDPLEREHVTLGIHCQYYPTSRPQILNVVGPADFSHLRWTLDTPEDLTLIQALYRRLYPEKPNFSWWDVLALITREPELFFINQKLERNWKLKQELNSKPLGE